MSVIFFVLALILIWLSYRSFRGGVDYLRFFKRELERTQAAFAPFVTVFAPCRGLDHDLEENLRAVVSQQYPAYEIIFVVDDPLDAAVPVIRSFVNDHARMIVAPNAVGSSQKVENLRAAINYADSRTEIFAFVDSDIRVCPHWLKGLVAPLNNSNIGAATGYRWFISTRPTFASELRSAWNASIASALGTNTGSNFCWGGSMAIRRDVFDRLNIREKWKGTLSDDFAVTRALREAKMPIVFVPSALTASIGDCSFRELLEFTTRQMKITRVYAPDLWASSLVGSSLFVIVMSIASLILIFSSDLFLWIMAALTIAAVAVFSIGKAWLRLDAVLLALPENASAIKHQRLTQGTLWLLTPAIFLYNSIAALFSRRITWRGIVYELKSPSETVIISD